MYVIIPFYSLLYMSYFLELTMCYILTCTTGTCLNLWNCGPPTSRVVQIWSLCRIILAGVAWSYHLVWFCRSCLLLKII
jgi:hypothetical protein